MNKLTSLTAEAGTLTVPQLEGWACVICAVLGIPTVYVGLIAGREVYACGACAAASSPPPALPLPRSGIWVSDEQLDGLACIRCHSSDAQMVPAGTGERGQLFECAVHADCPAWCSTNHMGGIDIEHVSDLITVAEPEGSEVTGDDGHVRTKEVVADLLQISGEALKVSVGVCEGVECLGSTEMSIDEAELMVRHLQTIIAAARTGARL